MSLNKKLSYHYCIIRTEKKAKGCGKEVNEVSREYPVPVCQSNLALACRLVLPRLLLIHTQTVTAVGSPSLSAHAHKNSRGISGIYDWRHQVWKPHRLRGSLPTLQVPFGCDTPPDTHSSTWNHIQVDCVKRKVKARKHTNKKLLDSEFLIPPIS